MLLHFPLYVSDTWIMVDLEMRLLMKCLTDLKTLVKSFLLIKRPPKHYTYANECNIHSILHGIHEK